MLLERSWTSIFHHFGVTVPAFLCSSTLPGTAFLTFPPPQTGGGQKAPILGGELLGSTFLLQLTRKHSLVGPHPPPQTGGGVISHFLLLSLHVFLGRVHGDAEIVPEKNRESFPLSKDVFWCWLRMLLLAEYCKNNFKQPRKSYW